MMVPSKSLLAFAGLALAGLASAQTQQSQELRVGPVYKGTYYAPTGKFVREGQVDKVATLVSCYIDTDATGFFGVGALTNKGDEWLDWGIVGGTSGIDCALVNSAILGQFAFAYATGTLDVLSGGPGQTIGVNFYSGTVGTSGDSANQSCVYSACFSGLPGHNGNTAFGTGWVITVSLTGGSEVCLPDGPFGFGLQQGDNGSFFGGAFANGGPLNVQAGAGTNFAPDSNGNIDFFSVWSPDSKTGTLVGNTFGFGASDHAAWYLTLSKANLATAARAVVRNPRTNQTSYTLSGSPGRLGGSAGIGIANVSGHRTNYLIVGIGPVSSPLGRCTWPAGRSLQGRFLYCGTILDVIFLGPNPTLLPALPNPKDVSLCGLTVCTQAVHLGGVRPYCLSNAIDVTFGG
jgi:hypothetical protein